MSKLIFFAALTVLTLSSSLAQWDSVVCPDDDSETTYFYPFWGDCSFYWMCFKGELFKMVCENGTEFDLTTFKCEPTEQANCDPYFPTTLSPTGSTPTEASSSTTTTDNDTTTTTSSATSATTDVTASTTLKPGPGPNCPFPSEELTYLPYDGDCTKYWACFEGNGYVYTCPEGLWWHQEVLQCDWPGDYCTDSTTPCLFSHNQCNMSLQHILYVFVTLTVISCAQAKWTPDPFCPFPSDHVTRYPYYGNCSVYWECYEGTKYVMPCPEGLEFNAPLQQCDAPEIANCDPFASTTENPNPPTYTTSHTSSHKPGPDCPYPSEELIYFPYPGDCTKYWECYEGNSYLYNCPPGLWWHQEISQCDYPGDFCTDGTTPTGITDKTTVSTDAPTTHGGEPDCTGTGDDPVYYPYPGDCTKYWECANGALYQYSCPEGLWWHEEVSQCDYPGDYCVP